MAGAQHAAMIPDRRDIFGIGDTSVPSAEFTSSLPDHDHENAAFVRERMHFLLSVTPAVVYSCMPTPPHAATFVSSSVKSQLGYEPREFTSDAEFWMRRIHPEDAVRLLPALPERIRLGQYIIEYRFLHAAGHYVWVRDEVRAVGTVAGSIRELVGCMTNITEQKRAEEQLRASERKYRQLIETTREGVWVIDAAGKTTFVNRRMAEMLGYGPDEMLGRAFYDFMNAETHAEGTTLLERRRQGIDERHDSLLRRRDGTELWTSMFANPLHDESGQFVGALAMVSDISDRKIAEENLRRARDELEARVAERTAELTAANAQLASQISERFRLDEERERLFSIIDQTTDLIGWGRPEGQLRYLNRAARAMLGIPPWENISQLHFKDLHPPWAQELLEREVIPALTRGGVWHGESALLARDGREVPIWQVIHAHRSPAGDVELLSGIAHDISAQKEVDEVRRQLAHSNRLGLLGEMSSTMAHELNQPLGTIANNASALMRRIRGGQLPPSDALEVLEDIAADALRAGEILRSVARFAAKRPAEVTRVDINDMVRDVIRLVDADVRRHGIRLTVRLAESVPHFQGGKVPTQQVLMNLVRNAIEAVTEHGTCEREVVITTQWAESLITVSVADSGPGLPADMMSQIFEPYFTTKPDGLGMGLKISRSILMSCGGRLWAERNPERGMTFYFTVPTTGGPGAQL